MIDLLIGALAVLAWLIVAGIIIGLVWFIFVIVLVAKDLEK